MPSSGAGDGDEADARSHAASEPTEHSPWRRRTGWSSLYARPVGESKGESGRNLSSENSK